MVSKPNLRGFIIPMLAWLLVASTRAEDLVSSGGTNIRRALFPRAAWVPGASGVFASIGYGIIAAFLASLGGALLSGYLLPEPGVPKANPPGIAEAYGRSLARWRHSWRAPRRKKTYRQKRSSPPR